MSGAGALQAAVVAALRGAAGIAGVVSGVFDGPPARAAFPYVAVEGGASLDWSTKTARGREHRVALTVWEENGRAARLRGLLDAVAAAIEAMPAELPGGRIASLAFLRERIARDATGPWAGLIEYRVRVLEG